MTIGLKKIWKELKMSNIPEQLKAFTPEQLRKLADKIEIEQEDKIFKIGYLKHDIYVNFNVKLIENHTFIFTKKTFDEFINEITNQFNIIKKGTKFVRFYDGWYESVDYIVECLDDTWAKEHLERIKDAK